MKKNINDVLNDLQDLLMMKKDLDEEIKKHIIASKGIHDKSAYGYPIRR